MPIEDATKLISYMILNGVVVEANKLRSNVHGCNVFVVKCQLKTECDGQMIIYDQVRDIILTIYPTEQRARGSAYHVLQSVIEANGAPVKMCLKLYLYAQRHFHDLRIFTMCFPSQEQPF